ncbi:Gustatory receptor 99 [Frankliniella occidentalis]|nr:Gustatory receptor 99 [Frankliniella occidentalis]
MEYARTIAIGRRAPSRPYPRLYSMCLSIWLARRLDSSRPGVHTFFICGRARGLHGLHPGGNVTYGALVNLALLAFILGFLASELFFAYMVASAMEGLDVDDLNLYLNLLAAEANGTARPTLAVESEFAQSQLTRVMKVSSGVALTVATLGLAVGYVRKLKHLPAVFRMGDELPGKPQWKTALFVAELSVYTIPLLTFLVTEFATTVLTLYIEARNVYLDTVQFMDLLAILFLLLITQVTTLCYGTCRSTSCKNLEPLQGNATAAIVHKIMNTRRFNEEEIQQLMIFSMQISHREISVSPYDMVTIDYSLLQAMLASVAMHIVILVQFNLSSTT